MASTWTCVVRHCRRNSSSVASHNTTAAIQPMPKYTSRSLRGMARIRVFMPHLRSPIASVTGTHCAPTGRSVLTLSHRKKLSGTRAPTDVVLIASR